VPKEKENSIRHKRVVIIDIIVPYDSNGIYRYTAVINNIFVIISISSEEHDSLILYFIPGCHKLFWDPNSLIVVQ
jgi:hypothetical protein